MATSQTTLLHTVVDKLKATFPSKGKKQIQNWDFIFTFQLTHQQHLADYFQNYLANSTSPQTTQYKLIKHQKQQQLLVLLKIDDSQVQKQAAALKILKKKKKKSYQYSFDDLNREIEQADQQKKQAMSNYLKWIRARMAPNMKQIYQQEMYSTFNLKQVEFYQRLSNGKLFTPEQQLRAKYNYLVTYSVRQQAATLQEQTYIYPLADIMKHPGFISLDPIQKRSNYSSIITQSIGPDVGANTQTYFDFLKFMQRWLVLPAIVGVLTVLFNVLFEFTADDSPGDFLYAFFVMIWSVVFITRWQHAQKWTEECNKVGYNEEWFQHQNYVDKQGCLYRQSMISGQKQAYIPLLQKIYRYFVSMSVLVGILVATLFFIILSLNARGFVDEKHKIIYFQSISQWAKQGGIFDANTNWAQIPNLVHVLVTNVFDEQIYRPLAKKFTKYEQHFAYKTYENNIIVKFFVYEFIITFADLFYIAFVRMDIIGLRQQLLSLFFIDIVRRLVAELVIPKISAKFRSYFIKNTVIKDVQSEQLSKQAILQVSKQVYEPFDDYLQIVTNFGYLVMISSCFPLAPLLILIAHAVQTMQDKYKIIHIFKGKLPSKYVGMGYWNSILVFLCYFSILTNIMLFAFSSQQIVSFFPSLYESSKDVLLGNTGFSDILASAHEMVASAASSVADTVSSSLVDTVAYVTSTFNGQTVNKPLQSFSPYDFPYSQFPIIHSFLPPAPQHEIQFISTIFIIEHVFLIIFLCLRNVLSKQQCTADILVQRRQLKRSIQKYLNEAIVEDLSRDTLRDHVVASIILNNKQHFSNNKQQGLLQSLISLGSTQQTSSISFQTSTISFQRGNTSQEKDSISLQGSNISQQRDKQKND